MASGRFGQGNSSIRVGAHHRHRRGFVIVKLPRHVIFKALASGDVAYYYNVPSRYRGLCPVRNEPLGKDYAVACIRAATLNGLFDEWDATRRGLPVTGVSAPSIGSVDWLFVE